MLPRARRKATSRLFKIVARRGIRCAALYPERDTERTLQRFPTGPRGGLRSQTNRTAPRTKTIRGTETWKRDSPYSLARRPAKKMRPAGVGLLLTYRRRWRAQP